MYPDIEEKLAAKRGIPYRDPFLCGLPIGMELPNGVVVGAWKTILSCVLFQSHSVQPEDYQCNTIDSPCSLHSPCLPTPQFNYT
jgi:hypothetical protein